MNISETPDAPTREIAPRKSFLTPEMIKANPVLEAAGLFAGDPAWQEIREEIKRNRERDQQEEAERSK